MTDQKKTIQNHTILKRKHLNKDNPQKENPLHGQFGKANTEQNKTTSLNMKKKTEHC